MEMSKTGEKQKKILRYAIRFNIGLICLGVLMAIAILFLDQLRSFLHVNSLNNLIYFAFILGGVLTVMSIANFMAGTYRIHSKHPKNTGHEGTTPM